MIHITFKASWRPEFERLTLSFIREAQKRGSLVDVRRRTSGSEIKIKSGLRKKILVVEGPQSMLVETAYSGEVCSIDSLEVLRVWFNQPSEKKLVSATAGGAITRDLAFFSEFREPDDEGTIILNYAPVALPRTPGARLVAATAVAIASRYGFVYFAGEVQVKTELSKRFGVKLVTKVEQVVEEAAKGEDFYPKLLDLGSTMNKVDEHVLFIFRNLLRVYVIPRLDRFLGRRLILQGSDWRKLGLRSLPTAHNHGFRRILQIAASANLDLGSKSTVDFLYPRSVELIEDGGIVPFLSSQEIKNPLFRGQPQTLSCLMDTLNIYTKSRRHELVAHTDKFLKEFLESARSSFCEDLYDAVVNVR